MNASEDNYQTRNRQECFQQAIQIAINEHCIDNDLNMPDFILAEYVCESLNQLQIANAKAREFGMGIRESLNKLQIAKTKARQENIEEIEFECQGCGVTRSNRIHCVNPDCPEH